MSSAPLGQTTSTVPTSVPVVSVEYTALQMSKLWAGKTIHQLPQDQAETLASGTLNKDSKVDIPKGLTNHKCMIIKTADGQSFLVRVKHAASIITNFKMESAQLDAAFKKQEFDPASVSKVKTRQAQTMAQTNPKALLEALKPAVDKTTTRMIGDQLPFEEVVIPHGEHVAEVYQRLASSGILNPESKLSVADLVQKHEFADLKGMLIEGPNNEILLKMPTLLGSGSWSDYSSIVNMRELTPLAIGDVKNVSKQGQTKTDEEHLAEIKGELSMKKQLASHYEGESLPFLLPIAHVSYENSEGEVQHARLAEHGTDVLKSDVMESATSLGKCTAQMFTALDVMGKAGIKHDDIKPENILIVNGNAKLADFGYATTTDVAASKDVKLEGSAWYFTPEKINGSRLFKAGKAMMEEGQKLIDSGYERAGKLKIEEGKAQCREGRKLYTDPKNDLWAMGVALYQISNGNEDPPFIKMCENKIPTDIQNKFTLATTPDEDLPPDMLPLSPEEKVQAKMAYQEAMIEELGKLTHDQVVASFPPYEEGSLMSILVQCFANNPPSPAELAKAAQVIMENDGPLE